MIQEALSEFGLTDKESSVYLACLHLGSALVQDIAKTAGTYRTYTYEVLSSLSQKGLVRNVIKRGKQYFEVASPETLLAILHRKEARIQEILPALQSMYKTSGIKPLIHIYEGVEGLHTLFDDMNKSGKEILHLGTTKQQENQLQETFKEHFQQRVRKRIPTKVLTERPQEPLNNLGRDRLRKTRFLTHPLPTIIDIYDDKVAMYNLETMVGIIIQDKHISSTQRAVFHALWDVAST